MGRRKTGEKNIRKLSRVGSKKSSSYYVTIPIDIIRNFNWREGQKLIVRKSARRDKIIVEDWEK